MAKLAARGRGRRTINEINMVPFIDVMLVLLIIFMVTAPLITPSQIDLPSVGQASRKSDAVVEVLMDKNERLTVREQGSQAQGAEVPLAQLAARVKQLQGDAGAPKPVVISADKNLKYDAVMRVLDTLQRAGVKRVGLNVQTTG